MDFPGKFPRTTSDLRSRARVTFQALKLAGRELNNMARRHASRFVEQNSSLVRDAGKDVSILARATLSQLTGRSATVTRKTPSKRRRATAKAA